MEMVVLIAVIASVVVSFGTQALFVIITRNLNRRR